MDDVVRGKVRKAGWTAVARGAYAASRDPDLGHRLRAVGLVLPESAAFTHLTSAELRGWWLPASVPHPLFAAVAERERHPQRNGLAVLRLARCPPAETFAGVRVAPAAETLLTCAADLGVLDLVPMADSALRLGHCTRADLVAATQDRRRGVRMLRTVLPLLDARSESPWESVLRVLHRVADVEVEPQHEIRTAAGTFIARADLWLVGTRRVHEYDGATATSRPTAPTSPATGGWSTTAGSGAATPRPRSCAGAGRSSRRRTPPSADGGTRTGSVPGGRWSPGPCTARPAGPAPSPAGPARTADSGRARSPSERSGVRVSCTSRRGRGCAAPGRAGVRRCAGEGGGPGRD